MKPPDGVTPMDRVTVSVVCAECGQEATREVAANHASRTRFCSKRCCLAAARHAHAARKPKPKPWQPSIKDRLHAKLVYQPLTGCLLWTGCLGKGGYGSFRMPVALEAETGLIVAHKFVYERWVGPVPEGLELDHLCNTPACCNPDHLEPVTHAENMRRAAERRKSVA